MNALETLNFQSNRVRIVDRDGEPWFVAADVCRILDLDTSVSVNGQWRKDKYGELYRSGGLDEDEKATHIVSTPGGEQEVLVISEPGFYALVDKSRKPEAKAFKRWVHHEVLPSIRRTGQYTVNPTQLPTDYLSALKALVVAEEEKAAQAAQLAAQAPKIALYETAMQAENALSMGAVAKLLGVGRNTLFAWLRQEKILMTGANWNLPFARYVPDYFDVREFVITHKDGSVQAKTQTMVTQRGMAYIHERWQAAHALPEVR